MKLRQGLQWKNTAGLQWNRENAVEVLTAIGAQLVFDLLCVLFFLYSSGYMVGMVYELPEHSPSFFVKGVWLVLLIDLLFESTRYMKKIPALVLRTAGLLGGMWIILRAVFREEVLNKLISGFWNVAYDYLKAWNSYYGDTWYCPEGSSEYGLYFVETALLTVVLLVFCLTKLFARNTSMAVIPLVLFGAGLLLGKEPVGKGILFLALGILVSCNQRAASPDFIPSEDKKGKHAVLWSNFGWAGSFFLVMLLCLPVFVAGKTSAEKMVTEYSGEAEDFIIKTADRVADWDIWRRIEDPGGVEKKIESILGTTDYNYEQLSNRSPVFEDIPVLKITLEDKLSENMYLRGFYADVYHNGIWERNAAGFEEFCRIQDILPETIAEQLGTLGTVKIKKRYNVNTLSAHSAAGVEFRIFYYAPDTVKAYLPYFMEEFMEGVYAEEEGNYKKRLSEEEISGTLWRYGGEYNTCLLNFAQWIPYPWETVYEAFVREQYLAVPEDMVNVKKLAAELADADVNRTGIGKIATENEERLAKAYIVADWLARNTSYSQKPPKLPFGKDPIEYFLGEGRVGYCMHYASAAVMLLRELGVPARYASGYVVPRTSFGADGENFTAEVLDNQAHAWAEVYLDSIGWVPVEVTAGYSTLIPTPTPTPMPTNTPTPTPTNTPTPTPTNTPVPTNTPTPIVVQEPQETNTPSDGPTMVPQVTDTPSHAEGGGAVAMPSPTPTPTPTPTPVPDSSELGNHITDNGIKVVEGEENEPEVTPEPELPPGLEHSNWKETLWKSIVMLVVVIAMVLILLSPATLVDHFFRLEKYSHRRIIKEMKRKGNTRAIKMLNRAIYRKLCFSGMVKKDCTDAELEQALRDNYNVVWPQDWERYMSIVKAAEFSLRDFTDEEVEFCYKIYRDVIY